MSTINDQVQEIINKRSATMGKIRSEQEKWTANKNSVTAIQQMVEEIKDKCYKALQKENNPEDVLTPLIDKLNTDFNNTVNAMNFNVSSALEELKNFRIETINIAVAGVGRSGKSTALKSILNLPQDDNSIIPSGNGARPLPQARVRSSA